MDDTISPLLPQDSMVARTGPLMRKRPQFLRQTVELWETPVKQRKFCNKSSNAPAAFWDNLSNVWLTPHALKELDRRNAAVISYQPHIESISSVADYLSRASLVEIAQIKTYARQGGPDLTDLRGLYLASESASYTMSTRSPSQRTYRQSTEPTNATISRRSSAYDKNFGQHLIDHGAYPIGYKYSDSSQIPEPDSLREIQSRLMEKRSPLSPSRFPGSAFNDFALNNEQVLTENMVMNRVLLVISGSARIPCAENLLFNGLDPLTVGSLVESKPDFYDGTPLSTINKKIQYDLGRYIIPSSSNIRALALPNFFTEVKSPTGGIDVARLQACYDGALSARAMHHMRSYATDEPAFDNRAYTITSTYHDGHLRLFAVHPTLPIGKSPSYHMTHLRSFAMTDTAETFRQGANVYRNARDWAKEQRDKVVASANKRATQLALSRSLKPRITKKRQRRISSGPVFKASRQKTK